MNPCLYKKCLLKYLAQKYQQNWAVDKWKGFLALDNAAARLTILVVGGIFLALKANRMCLSISSSQNHSMQIHSSNSLLQSYRDSFEVRIILHRKFTSVKYLDLTLWAISEILSQLY